MSARTSLKAAEEAIATTGVGDRAAVACHNGPESVSQHRIISIHHIYVDVDIDVDIDIDR